MKSFWLILFTTLTLFTQAQNRKYYNYNHEPTSEKEYDAYYYIESTKLKTGEFEQKKYHVKHNYLMEIRACKSIDPLIFHGNLVRYNKNGGIESKLTLKNNLVIDTAYFYDDNGKLSKSRYYQNDTPIVEQEFYPSGKLYSETIFKNELPKSIQYYYETGEKKRSCYYNKIGEFRNGMCFTKEGKDTPYFEAFTPPLLDKDLYAFIGANLSYPESARAHGLTGRVIVQFVVTKNDSIEDIQIESSSCELFNNSVINLILASDSHWKAAIKEGQKVPIRMTLPIKFNLD